jgi:hypothetical protein
MYICSLLSIGGMLNFLSGSKIKLVYTEHSTSGRRIKVVFFKKTDPYFTGNTIK